MTYGCTFLVSLLISFLAKSLALHVPLPASTPTRALMNDRHLRTVREAQTTPSSYYQPPGVTNKDSLRDSGIDSTLGRQEKSTAANNNVLVVAALALLGTPTSALAAVPEGGSIPSAALAWLHFVGIMGVAGGLMTERFLIQYNINRIKSCAFPIKTTFY